MSEVDLRSLHKKSSKKAAYLITAAVLAAIGFLAWFYLARDGEAETRYITAPLERKDLKVMVRATGNLEPLRTVTVGIEVSGTLKEVLADYNDRVKVNQVLARLDMTKLESALTSAKAQLKVAKASVQSSVVTEKEALSQLERLEQIHDSTRGAYPSQKEMQTARAAWDRASSALQVSRAQLEQAEADVKTNEENLRKAVVVSPINGTILTRQVDVGQTVAASMQTPTLFTIAEDLSKMQVVVAVDEADVGDVREGQRVTFSVNAYPGREFNGVVKQVRLGSQITSGVVTYNAVVLVDNPDQLLRPGMTAQASIITKLTADALCAPNAAFRFAPPKKAASMISFKPRSKDKTISIYILEDGEPRQIEVSRGDSDGACSAVKSEDYISEGMPAIVGIQTENK